METLAPQEGVAEILAPVKPAVELARLDPASVRACLARRQSLPTLPDVFTRLSKISTDPNANLVDLAEVISRDPVLTANVLKAANSAYLGLREHVTDLSSAIFFLGLADVKHIAMSVGSFDVFRVKGVSSEFLKDIWRHSLSTALVAKQIARSSRFPWVDDAYLAGLLHDIGKLFFATFYTTAYAPLCAEAATGNSNPLELEKHVFGMNHVEASKDLCEHWRLPPQVTQVAIHHHDPSQAKQDAAPMTLCVAACNVLAHHALGDRPVDQQLPQAYRWLQQLSATGGRPELLTPAGIDPILKLEVERVKRFEDIVQQRVKAGASLES